MRDEIIDFYYKDKKLQEEKRKRKENIEFKQDEEDSIDEYLNDNSQKRIFMKFYKYFEKKYNYEICPINELNEHHLNEDDKSKSISGTSKNITISQQSKSKYTNNTNKSKPVPVNDIIEEVEENDENKIKKFCPSSIIIKEKSSNFIKWISSIFQTINDSNITDYANVRKNLSKKNFIKNIYFSIAGRKCYAENIPAEK